MECFLFCKLDCPASDLLQILPLIVGNSSHLKGIFTESLVKLQCCGIVYSSSK